MNKGARAQVQDETTGGGEPGTGRAEERNGRKKLSISEVKAKIER